MKEAVQIDSCIEAARRVLHEHSRVPYVVPVNVEEIALGLGFQIVRLFSVADEFSGMVSPRHNLVGINGNHHIHRQRYTVAHELGHIVLNHPPESRCTIVQIHRYNRQADLFASELLMPEEVLHRYLRTIKSVSVLARLFQVSEEAMTRRLEQRPVT